MKKPRLYPASGLHGRIAHEIGRRIVSGAIREGALLPREAELSGQFGVSRQAVREGLKVLAAKGLVAARRHVGTAVLQRENWNLFDPDILAWHTLTPDFLADLLEMRRLIEPAAAAMAASRGCTRKVTAIMDAVEQMQAAEPASDAFFDADVAFHMGVLAASGNEMIDRIGIVSGPLMRASFPLHFVGATASAGSEEAVRDVVAASVAQHRSVAEAIAARDPALARREMAALVEQVATEVRGLGNETANGAGPVTE